MQRRSPGQHIQHIKAPTVKAQLKPSPAFWQEGCRAGHSQPPREAHRGNTAIVDWSMGCIHKSWRDHVEQSWINYNKSIRVDSYDSFTCQWAHSTGKLWKSAKLLGRRKPQNALGSSWIYSSPLMWDIQTGPHRASETSRAALARLLWFLDPKPPGHRDAQQYKSNNVGSWLVEALYSYNKLPPKQIWVPGRIPFVIDCSINLPFSGQIFRSTTSKICLAIFR